MYRERERERDEERVQSEVLIVEETCPINAQCTTVGVTIEKIKEIVVHVYRLPAVLEERQKWINALPYFNLSNCELSNFRVCLKHWETNCPIEMKFAVKNNL